MSEPHMDRKKRSIDHDSGPAYHGSVSEAELEIYGLTIDQVIEETVEPTIFLGEGVLKFEERLRVVEHGSLAPRALCDPNGAAVAHLGALQIEAGMITDVEAAEPNYCRASQAERERVKDPDERG